MLKGVSWVLQQSDRESPPFILVAIGYPGDSPVAGALLRARDLSFPECPSYFNRPQALLEWEEVLCPDDGTKDFCGAEDFQRFIGKELIPLIDENYETVRGHRSYFGHSMGGSFGLFTLFTQPHLFRNYIISSAAVSYHGETPGGTSYENHDFMLRLAQKWMASGRSLDSVRLYMSVGSEEQFDPTVANWEFASSFFRMVALMKAASLPGLKLLTEVFPGETHATVWPIAFMHGIQAVFETRRLP